MMKHYDILIIMDQEIQSNLLKNLNYKFERSVSSLDIFKTNTYSFDYLITDNTNNLQPFDCLSDNGTVITNCFFETSVENVYIIGDNNITSLSKTEQLDKVLNNIIN